MTQIWRKVVTNQWRIHNLKKGGAGGLGFWENLSQFIGLLKAKL